MRTHRNIPALLVAVVAVVSVTASCGHQPIPVQATAAAKPLPTADLPSPAETQDVAPVPAPPVISPAAAKAAEKVTDKAAKVERLDQPAKLAGQWVTPAPDAIKAAHTADDAEAVVKKAHNDAKPKADDRKFALLTGGPRQMLPDGSAGPPLWDNLPVWIVTYTGIPVSNSGPPGGSSSSPVEILPPTPGKNTPTMIPPCGGGSCDPNPQPYQPMVGTQYTIIDDTTGKSLVHVTVGGPVGGGPIGVKPPTP